MAFYESIINQYFERIGELGVQDYFSCVVTVFSKWPISKLNEIEFKTSATRLSNIRKTLNEYSYIYNLSLERLIIMVKKFNLKLTNSNKTHGINCTSQELKEIKDKYPTELVESCLYVILPDYTESDVENKIITTNYTVKTVQAAIIAQRYCIKHNKTFTFINDDIKLVHSFSKALISSYGNVICNNEETMDILIDLNNRQGNKMLPFITCKNSSLIEKFYQSILKKSENKEFADSIATKKKLSKQDIKYKYFLLQRINHWVVENNESYYKELYDNNVDIKHPISIDGLRYLSKMDKVINYRTLSFQEVFQLIDFGYNRFPKNVNKIYNLFKPS